jgi:hypothetical protein
LSGSWWQACMMNLATTRRREHSDIKISALDIDC